MRRSARRSWSTIRRGFTGSERRRLKRIAASPRRSRATIRRTCAGRRMETNGIRRSMPSQLRAPIAGRPLPRPTRCRSRAGRTGRSGCVPPASNCRCRSGARIHQRGRRRLARESDDERKLDAACSAPIQPGIGAPSKQNCVMTSTWIRKAEITRPEPSDVGDPTDGSVFVRPGNFVRS